MVVDYVMVTLMSEVSAGVRTGMRQCRVHSDARRQGTSLSTVLDCWS